MMLQAEGRTVPAHLAFDYRVDVIRDLRRAGWIVLEVWEALELIGSWYGNVHSSPRTPRLIDIPGTDP